MANWSDRQLPNGMNTSLQNGVLPDAKGRDR